MSNDSKNLKRGRIISLKITKGPLTGDKMAPSASQTVATMNQQQRDEEALRAQVHEEIEERSRACGHRRYACQLPRLPGWSRCRRHILDEPAAPYRRCRFRMLARRCSEPAQLHHKHHTTEGLCFEHARLAMTSRMKTISRPTPKPSAETLLLSLAHHVNPERVRTESCASQISVVSEASDSHDTPLLVPPDPFKQVNAADVNSSLGPSLLDCWSSEEDSEEETLCRGNQMDEDSSGAEDTPLDAQPLRFAGIYTCQEVVNESSASLRRLQALYLGQLQGLTRQLREARRTYLASLKLEKETHCNIHSQGTSTLAERKQRAILKATTSYRKRHGVDAILHRKLHDKRVKVSEGSGANRSHSATRCCFTEGGVKCVRPAVLAARHCAKHILNDRHQVLFKACGVSRAGLLCQEPTPALHPAATCALHACLPSYQTFSLKKYESDSEDTTTESGSPVKPSGRASSATDNTSFQEETKPKPDFNLSMI